MIGRVLRYACLSLALFSGLSFGAGEALLDEITLLAKLEQAPDYQLLDARNAAARKAAPIAFSTRYRLTTPLKKGLVLIVADNDAAALKIAISIPVASDRSVFAVKGGADAWKRAAAKTSAPSSVSTSFVIPMNTCEQGKPLQEIKRNKPLQQFKTK
jgi:hypothetical protein